MSKRGPISNLNHDNWDQEDEEDDDNDGGGPGTFARASDEVLKTRVIKKIKRRIPNNNSLETTGAFSNFLGFGKTTGSFGSSSTSATSTASSSPFAFLQGNMNSGNSSGGGKPTNGSTSATSPVKFNNNTSFSDACKMNNIFSSSTTTTTTSTSTLTTTTTTTTTTSGAQSKTTNEHSTKYYAKIKGLNMSVSKWISECVAKNPVCNLICIFDDYKKHLETIEDEEKKSNSTTGTAKSLTFLIPSSTTSDSTSTKTTTSTSNNFSTLTFGSKLNSGDTSTAIGSSIFGTPMAKPATTTTTTAISPSLSSLTPSSASTTGFSFMNTSNPPISSSFFTSNAKSFTFGQKTDQTGTTTTIADGGGAAAATTTITNNDDEDEEPPKNVFVPVIESDSVYSTRCKVFIKKDNDGGYAERGVGTLYIKILKTDNKNQLLVRADTNLGNILLNVLLTESLPTQRIGKNNVMLVSIPTPQSSPPTPKTILLRVKTESDANELLEQINKHKK